MLFVGGDGKAELAPKGVQVTAKVVGHVLGEKIRIGKYKKRTGYKRHNGFRASSRRSQIEAIGKKATRGCRPKAADGRGGRSRRRRRSRRPRRPGGGEEAAARKTTTTKKKAE